MKTFIYLRSVIDNEKNSLALFDSERHGNINDLITIVSPGSTIVWKLDSKSGIKGINKVFMKLGKDNKFGAEPRKHRWCKRWVLKIPKEARGEEAYGIEYTLCDGKTITIDPYIKIKYP